MGLISARAAGDVVELRPEDTRWLRFVAGASEASAFHEPGWLAALTASYGYQSLVLALMASGGEVIAGLPLSRIRRPLSGVAYVSLPFTDHCPPLANNEDALLLLAQRAEVLGRSVGISAIEIRGPLPGTGSLAADAVGNRHLPTLDGPARGLGALKPAVARHVRAARRAGVSIQFGPSWEDMQRFYRLHLLTRRRPGVPVRTDLEVLSRACAASRAPHCDTTSRSPRVSACTRNTRGIIQISVSALRRRLASARPVERGDVAGSEQEHPSPDSEAMRR